MTTTLNDAASESVQALLERVWQEDQRLCQEQDQSLAALSEVIEGLNAWSERLEQWQADSEASQKSVVQLEQALEQAAERIDSLEVALQERTEELLRSQAANNALAALQTADLPHAPPKHADSGEHAPLEFAPPAEGPEVAKPGQSVSERFERLRKKRSP